jgi:hypothetical protein
MRYDDKSNSISLRIVIIVAKILLRCKYVTSLRPCNMGAEVSTAVLRNKQMVIVSHDWSTFADQALLTAWRYF